ncbi:hypothetical protein IJ670_02205 [bacterium]|nr:hypothetical protein [bacterium]
MKKFIVLFLLFSLNLANAYELIEDDFILKTLNPKLKIQKYEKPEIKEDLYFSNPKEIKTYEYKPIEDEFIEISLDKNLTIKRRKYRPIREDKDFTPITVKITQPFSTKSKALEGSKLQFVLERDVEINSKTYKKGSVVEARIEVISPNRAFGIPANLTVGNFKINETELIGEISKTGANRTLWLYPSIYVGSWFFGAGLLLMPVRGGHAKIKTNELFTLFVPPEEL